MLSYPVVLNISAVVVLLISIFVLMFVGFIPFLVVIGVAGLVFYLVTVFGDFDVKVSQSGLEVDFHENAAGPADAPPAVPSAPIPTKEVFNISGNKYTYEEAAAVCAAYDSELASFDQISHAFDNGAEWCNYGWSVGAMALYPTQESTWSALQADPNEERRTACGRPGVNGGYFDTNLKFGVNCFGVKPTNKDMKFPQNLPTTDNAMFNDMVSKFKKMLKSMTVASFNRYMWSESTAPTPESKAPAAPAPQPFFSISSYLPDFGSFFVSTPTAAPPPAPAGTAPAPMPRK